VNNVENWRRVTPVIFAGTGGGVAKKWLRLPDCQQRPLREQDNSACPNRLFERIEKWMV